MRLLYWIIAIAACFLINGLLFACMKVSSREERNEQKAKDNTKILNLQKEIEELQIENEQLQNDNAELLTKYNNLKDKHRVIVKKYINKKK